MAARGARGVVWRERGSRRTSGGTGEASAMRAQPVTARSMPRAAGRPAGRHEEGGSPRGLIAAPTPASVVSPCRCVSYRDPFGLSAEDVSVNCRAVGDSGEGNAAHCAVRVVDESRDLDVTIELLNENWTNEVYWRSRAGDAEAQGYNPGRWARVAVPVGMTSHEFDDRVLQQAMLHTRAARGQDYHFWGGSNSNRFVFNIITSAGGMVPGAASRAFKIAPGICGGGGLSRGGQCSP